MQEGDLHRLHCLMKGVHSEQVVLQSYSQLSALNTGGLGRTFVLSEHLRICPHLTRKPADAITCF